MLKYFFYITGLACLLICCQKEDIDPVGFYHSNYITNPNEAQEFEYFFDDGELVADGLENFVLKIKSEENTFDEEKLILIKSKRIIEGLSDTLILPFTYFMGVHYEGNIKKELEVELNLNYQFDNYLHQNYSEYLYFREHPEKLKLYEIKAKNEDDDLFYNPEITYQDYPFELYNNSITFKTSDKDALFGLCWTPENWYDTISITSNTFYNDQILQPSVINPIPFLFYSVNQNPNLPFPGCRYDASKNIASFAYGIYNAACEPQTLYNLQLLIESPANGIVNHDQLIISDLEVLNSDGKRFAYKFTENSIVELVHWPAIDEIGVIRIYGPFEDHLTDTLVNFDVEIKFKRYR